LICYDNDVHPGFHFYESADTALNIGAITGSTHSRVIQCLTSTKPSHSFDEDLSKFQELADGSSGNRGDANPGGPSSTSDPSDGRLSTIQEEDEYQDMDAFIMETWYSDLKSSHEYLEDLSLEEQLQEV